VEAHAFMRDGLRAVLHLELDVQVAVEAASGEEAQQCVW